MENLKKFQGKKSSSIFILLEEAKGINKDIWNTTESMLNNKDSYCLSILAPTDIVTKKGIK